MSWMPISWPCENYQAEDERVCNHKMNIIWRTQVIGIKIIGGKEKGVLGKIEMRN